MNPGIHQIELTAASDKVYQLLAHGRWFSPGTKTYFCFSAKHAALRSKNKG
jgi:hypothetical protein